MYNKPIHSSKVIKTLLQYSFILFGFRIVMQIIVSILIVHCSKFSIGRPVQNRKNNIYIYLPLQNILKNKKTKNKQQQKTKKKNQGVVLG